MDVRRKVAILADAGSVRDKEMALKKQSVQFAEARAAAMDSPGRGSVTESSKKIQDSPALTLWKEWAVAALGPMSDTPTEEESKKRYNLRKLERQCAELSASAQQRLELSAAICTAPLMGASPYGGSHGRARPLSAGTVGSFSREQQWAARERHRAVAYAAVRNTAAAEPSKSGSPQLQQPGAAARHGATAAAQLRSHELLESMMQQQQLAAKQPPRPQSATSKRLDRQSSMPPRPSSAQPQPLSRSSTRGRGAPSPDLAGNAQGGSGGGGAEGRAAAAAETRTLHEDVAALQMQLDLAQAQMQTQAEVEAQLHETVDLLRARLHGQGQREVEHQRRLSQYTRYEPIFDRLAETFTFGSAEEVLARLEALEETKLGAMDQLIRAQEEVASLQSQLSESHKRVDTVRTQLTTEALQGMARMQEQKDGLHAELESMEGLVRRLESRQSQLVALQTGILDLWGRCQKDPSFVAANSGPGGQGVLEDPTGQQGRTDSESGAGPLATDRGNGTAAAASAAANSESLDARAILSSIQEWVIAHSPKLAVGHYVDVQRVANRVWDHHLRHRPELRGRMVQTFEHMSAVADMLASRFKTVQTQLKRSQDNEKALTEHIKRLQTQKRAVESELDRRRQYVRDTAGTPHWDRKPLPADLAATPSWAPATAGRLASPTRPQSARPVLTTVAEGAGPPPLAAMATSGTSATAARYGSGAGAGAASLTKARPQSAPAQRPHSAMASRYGVAAGVPTGPGRGSVQVIPRAGAMAGGASAGPPVVLRMVSQPVGDHWATFLSSAPPPGPVGALHCAEPALHAATQPPAAAFNAPMPPRPSSGKQSDTAAVAPGARVVAAAGGSPAVETPQQQATVTAAAVRWSPPVRSSIEASFLRRLERAAGVTVGGK